MKVLFLLIVIISMAACIRNVPHTAIAPKANTPPQSSHDSSSAVWAQLQDPLSAFWGGNPDSTPVDSLKIQELALLQEGDIVMRKGYGSVSDFIAVYLNEDYPVTHCAFLLKEGYDAPQVLHTASNEQANGMFVEPLAQYVAQSKIGSIAVVRLKGSADKKREVLAEAKRLLAKGVAFDMKFDDQDSSQMYCAEMMRYVFKNVYKEDLLSKRAQKYGLDVIQMDNFFNPKYFEVVLNHFDSIPVPVQQD